MAEWAQLSLYSLNISLDSLLPPRSAAEGDREEEDDGGEAGRDPEEQVLHKLRPGSQLLGVPDLVGHLPQAPIVHDPPDASSQQEESQQGQQGVGDDQSEPDTHLFSLCPC